MSSVILFWLWPQYAGADDSVLSGGKIIFTAVSYKRVVGLWQEWAQNNQVCRVFLVIMPTAQTPSNACLEGTRSSFPVIPFTIQASNERSSGLGWADSRSTYINLLQLENTIKMWPVSLFTNPRSPVFSLLIPQIVVWLCFKYFIYTVHIIPWTII